MDSLNSSPSAEGLGLFCVALSILLLFNRIINNRQDIDETRADANDEPGTNLGIDSIPPIKEHIATDNVQKVPIVRAISRNSDSVVDATKGLDNVEILLHNISHKDFVVALQMVGTEILARPEFNHYNAICKHIHEAMQSIPTEVLSAVHMPVHNRHQGKEQADFSIPVGYNLKGAAQEILVDKSKLRIRHKPFSVTDAALQARVVAVYAPLLALLLPKWLAHIDINTSGRSVACRKVLFLVSGEGTPGHNSSKSPEQCVDNSTEYSAFIMKAFVTQLYPDIQVVMVHSATNVFRYDENIDFVKHTLVPHIEKYRNVLAAKIGAKWRDKFHLTLSLADGASARVSAINASLRYYRPSFMHFWQLKTFFNEDKVYEDDIESHSYEEILTIPAVPPDSASALIQQTVHTMKQFIVDFDSACTLPDQELSQFWMRKSLKPVLAVLLVQTGPGSYKTYRGTNMEVSMPTGSLCAERNVIGSALADNLGLKRKDFRVLAVYSASVDAGGRYSRKPSSLCAECGPGDLKTKLTMSTDSVASVVASETYSPSIRQVTLDRAESWTEMEFIKYTRDKSMTPPLPFAGGKMSFEEDNQLSVGRSSYRTIRPGAAGAAPKFWNQEASLLYEVRPQEESASHPSPGTLPRDLPTQSSSEDLRRNIPRGTTKTVSVEERDMNPLKPCGACSEWLKKIAEVNPEFTIITFTDQTCEGIYIEQIDTA